MDRPQAVAEKPKPLGLHRLMSRRGVTANSRCGARSWPFAVILAGPPIGFRFASGAWAFVASGRPSVNAVKAATAQRPRILQRSVLNRLADKIDAAVDWLERIERIG